MRPAAAGAARTFCSKRNTAVEPSRAGSPTGTALISAVSPAGTRTAAWYVLFTDGVSYETRTRSGIDTGTKRARRGYMQGRCPGIHIGQCCAVMGRKTTGMTLM